MKRKPLLDTNGWLTSSALRDGYSHTTIIDRRVQHQNRYHGSVYELTLWGVNEVFVVRVRNQTEDKTLFLRCVKELKRARELYTHGIAMYQKEPK